MTVIVTIILYMYKHVSIQALRVPGFPQMIRPTGSELAGLTSCCCSYSHRPIGISQIPWNYK